jgi:hypothetical protein
MFLIIMLFGAERDQWFCDIFTFQATGKSPVQHCSLVEVSTGVSWKL